MMKKFTLVVALLVFSPILLLASECTPNDINLLVGKWVCTKSATVVPSFTDQPPYYQVSDNNYLYISIT
jgi:hypothetical protein